MSAARPWDRASATILAMQDELTGLGLLPPGDERTATRNLADLLRPGQQPTQPCGTEAAYQRHYRHGEKPCQDCRDGHDAYRAWLRGTRKEAAAPAAVPVQQPPVAATPVSRCDACGYLDSAIGHKITCRSAA